MKIKSQFIISIVTFFIMVIIIAGGIIVAVQGTVQLDRMDEIASSIQTGASNLNYIANNYFLYQQNSSIGLWQSQYSQLENDISNVSLTYPEGQALVNAVKGDLGNLQIIFNGVLLFLQSSPRNSSVRVLPEFQTEWNRMFVQIQALSFDSQQLSDELGTRSNQLDFTLIVLIVSLLGLFGAYFVTNYWLTSRKTLGSIKDLKDGIAVIGSGNLDYKVKAGRNDEIAEISDSVNQMAANLKTVTASKKDLEAEVAERKKAEAALLESERLYRTVFDNSEDGFELVELIYDETGKVSDERMLRVNRAFEKQTGLKAVDVIGKKVSEYSSGTESYWFEVQDEVLKTGKPTHYENYAGNTKKFYDLYIFPYSEKTLGILLRDITGRKDLEKQLQDNERLAGIGATAGMVGHDIRNPLQAIMGDVYLLKDYLSSMPEVPVKKDVSEGLMEIEKNIGYINKIVSDLQDYARPLHPEYSLIDLEALVDSAFQTIDVPQNVNLSIDLHGVSNVRTDPTFIRRALTNLANNAIQAMPNGGTISVAGFQEENKLFLTISDTGIGIPEEVKSKLFRPMLTTKAKGQGLGLAVVKRLVEALNGTVSFESEKGKGTKFIIKLPID